MNWIFFLKILFPSIRNRPLNNVWHSNADMLVLLSTRKKCGSIMYSKWNVLFLTISRKSTEEEFRGNKANGEFHQMPVSTEREKSTNLKWFSKVLILKFRQKSYIHQGNRNTRRMILTWTQLFTFASCVSDNFYLLFFFHFICIFFIICLNSHNNDWLFVVIAIVVRWACAVGKFPLAGSHSIFYTFKQIDTK